MEQPGRKDTASRLPKPEKPPQKHRGKLREPTLRTPSHGRGKLKTGGTPGNKGGGRLPSEVKKTMLDALDERIPALVEIVDRELRRQGKKIVQLPARDSDRIKALEVLAKYAIGQTREVSGPNGGPIPTESRVVVYMPDNGRSARPEAAEKPSGNGRLRASAGNGKGGSGRV